ncbi:transcription factor Jun [Neodiprion pinetum]|uniref:Transcription factor AP-1 n=1 Tax=Neodiprion lecontei TaxID=441921 RepID=A0A6J0B5H1_NEOLC|nr:transcription factor AP-1 [Neodiprion lecontei]XP_046436727.1 transcription factor AP-1 [Neodiprion fabricii]XP_046467765.1 transcription factor AP-1 [Neodiprion pinetum]XP_046605400.1 transcription factor AP-1 [Neodiprion virginianus]
MVRNSVQMEQTFYEESAIYAAANRADSGMGQLKRSLTLDLNGQRATQAKRPRLGPLPPALNNAAPVLSSPDLNMLKLGSPELEKLIIAQQNGLVTTMPTPTTQILFPKTVTEEQELYARGFVDALNELHHSDSSQEPGSIHGATYTNLEPPGSVQSTESLSQSLMMIKDEPQTVPSVSSSPPMSPIDMESQERIKLERKRQRNRVAASKCRRRKLERISRLEDKVKILKGENSELSAVVNRLKEHVCRLKEQVMDHVHSGCHIMPVSQF